MSALLLFLACATPYAPDGVYDETAAPDGEDDGSIEDSEAVPDDDPAPSGDDASTATVTVEPPLGQTSGGSGGIDIPNGQTQSEAGATWTLIAPVGSSSGVSSMLVVYSGTEGRDMMAANMSSVGPYFGLDDTLILVLDGRTSTAEHGAIAMDAVRAQYDVDNDRTWLLSESAGTREGLELGLELRQSWFAAYWANDVNASATPAREAVALGFAPWGNAGPGGDFASASSIVAGMEAAGYRTPSDAPYSGPGAGAHGSTDQFLAAVGFFPNLSR